MVRPRVRRHAPADRRQIPLQPRDEELRYFNRRTAALGRSFLEHAASGDLPSVSWIDPNFVDFDLLGPAGSNDDHPPSDVKAGQQLVLALYAALASSPTWSKTLLVITYDEHGGFFDHVPAPGEGLELRLPLVRAARPRARRLTVDPARDDLERALRPHVDHQDDPAALLPRRGRLDSEHGRPGREREPPRGPAHAPNRSSSAEAAALRPLIKLTSQWQSDELEDKLLTAKGRPPREVELNELQEGYLKAKDKLRRDGVPAGMPCRSSGRGDADLALAVRCPTSSSPSRISFVVAVPRSPSSREKTVTVFDPVRSRDRRATSRSSNRSGGHTTLASPRTGVSGGAS